MRWSEIVEALPGKPRKPLTPAQSRKRSDKLAKQQERLRTAQQTANQQIQSATQNLVARPAKPATTPTQYAAQIDRQRAQQMRIADIRRRNAQKIAGIKTKLGKI